MTTLQTSPRNEILIEGQVRELRTAPVVPEEAYPPVIDGDRPLMVTDDITLDLTGGDGPQGFGGMWVIRGGNLYLRWLLGRNRVAWDLRADWYSGDLDFLVDGHDEHLHVERGNLAA